MLKRRPGINVLCGKLIQSFAGDDMHTASNYRPSIFCAWASISRASSRVSLRMQ